MRFKKNKLLIPTFILILLVCYYVLEKKDYSSKPSIFTDKLAEDLRKQKIPKKIHQIWVGTDTPPEYYHIFSKTLKNQEDFEYRLWTNKDLTRENFPLTYDTILKLSEAGIKISGPNPKNWNQTPSRKLSGIADLMKFEIIYNHGGYYFDAKGEILSPLGTEFFEEGINKSFIVANEDPCQFSCENEHGKYISTAFFGASKSHPILKVLLEKENLERINVASFAANVETGPTFFGKVFTDELRKNKEKFGILMLDTKRIYPYINWDSNYRKAGIDLCTGTDPKKLGESKKTTFTYKDKVFYTLTPCDKYKESFVVFHFDVGYTWGPPKK